MFIDISQLKKYQTRDLGRIISLKRSLQQRQQQQKNTDSIEQKLQVLCAESEKKTILNTDRLGQINTQLDNELPIANHAQEIINLLNSHQLIIVAGETGCGKTTQLPKICVQAGLGARGIIGHTQPRRVAATSVAKRIADETECELGTTVGYSIRFANKYSGDTQIKLMTDGVLLAEVEQDPLLSRYEVIIIDEAHERSLNIDFLLGFLKNILNKRKDLKVIITSATIDPERFSKHFNQAPIVTVEGRSYPVEVRYREVEETEDPQEDNLMIAVINAVDECCSESSGDILIFADGEGQIKSVAKQLKQAQIPNLEILPLYARLSVTEQQKIFAQSNKRKVIVSTNVAETSLTVPGIIFVIDIGTARISRFSQRNKIQQLPIEKISKASADQRKGRCGRIAPGICIRLYSEEDYNLREEFTSPEIKRTNLSWVVLKLKAMKVKQIEEFPFVESPDERAWKVAFNSLFELSALDEKRDITQIGQLMAKIPADPQLARILVDKQLTAVDEMLILCSLMCVREVRERPHDKQQKADQLHQQYNQGGSDILTAIELWRCLSAKKAELTSSVFKKWCVKNLINFLGYLEWRRVYYQLKEAVEALGTKVNSTATHPDEVHKAMIPGFISHIFQRSQDVYYHGVRGLKVWLHPSSLYFKQKKSWLLSAEMIETEKFYARMNGEIQPEWIESAAPHLLKHSYKDVHWRKKNGQVMAYANITLLGLPIAVNRLINYSTVDIERSRNCFLMDGLASDQLFQDFPFIKANREKLLQLEEQEQKQRLNNIRIDKASLAEKYASVLPEHIVSFISLKRWLKKDFKNRNQLLSFTLNELTQNEAALPEAYPSTLIVKGVELNLSYCFSPGSENDGVSVEIPKNMLSQFTDRDFDWLVPGYLEEKTLAAIKTLPKTFRKKLIPLSETANECYALLINIDKKNKRFLDELAHVLQKVAGIQVNAQDFEPDSLESHLTMKYKVLGTNTQSNKGALSSLSELKQKLKKQPRQNQSGYSNQKIVVWPVDIFEVEKIEQQNNQNIRVFQGLKDCETHVEINQYPSHQAALNAHVHGVARLLLLNNANLLNQFFKGWPDYQALERLNIRFGGFKGLFQVLAFLTAKKLLREEKVITTKDSFLAISSKFEQTFRESISSYLNNLKPLLKQREKLFSQLIELESDAYKASVEDMLMQLKQLWNLNILVVADDSFEDDYIRYQKGISVRIKRLTTNFPKENQSLEVWNDWYEWWQDLQKHRDKAELGYLFNEMFWLLQEYRLSLFSPGVKANGGISAKKLQKKFEFLEREIDAF